MRPLLVLAALAAAASAHAAPPQPYPWLSHPGDARALEDAFPAPRGYHRVPEAAGSFGAWLRRLPLRPAGTPVRSFRGDELHAADDPRIAAVIDLDVGTRDLQQCADSIMRLDAEWRFAGDRAAEISYPIGHGQALGFRRWAAGERPKITDDDRISWSARRRADASHESLRAYLDVVFAWAGTASLSDGTRTIARADARPGDFFILGGHPGHTVLILDLVEDGHGSRRALLGQGFMPAQDFQVVAHDGDPWFSLDGDDVATPFWVPFPWTSLHRL